MRMAVASVSTAIAIVEDQDQMFVCTIAQTRASFLRLRKFSARQPDAYCEWKTKKKHKILQITACTTSLNIFVANITKKIKRICKIAFCWNMLQTSTTCVSGQQMISEQMPTLTQSSNSLHLQPYKIHFQVTQTWNCFCWVSQLRFSFSSWSHI